MNKQRAKEIAASPVMANVTCDGIPVYIQHIDDDNDMARIYPLDQPDQEMSVPVASLREHGEY
ncbi:small acid-soluble spore protein H [Brevibacillus formosus]|uniref:Spore protein H n=2 Tax=Brevibacillus TaxID=55080 RepID=A0A837KKH7_9BACL|nr:MULTISPECIES: small acid-soluble spore protein H [Brevibacillus]KLH97615.1 spore protein H [Brevibacillus formosus]MED1780675.1 small acid-soluble spore protein H [Brevibacillus fortis]MED1957594.1 small acid-soluble spore protein H [Brevibacillus formosus]PSJ86593.1 H-type small acid-soluble spore protein [Brevibacillus fortis]PSJ98978.1 H-type small acid-soluble spore protein [Brevibacillus formosus]